MTKQEMMHRTRQFAIENAKLVLSVPLNVVNKNYCGQLARSASSTGANYRAACRAKSTPDFINKLKIVEEELDESMFFLELLVELNPDLKEKITPIYREANELLSIIVSSINTSRANKS
ncbi:four helix bundle protein [Mucilaginibacter sp.]|uniref:four helix bundle protein n=1 Tax=Mucilaginibacter sp. TaxID=1882438 RepID=UPI000CBD8A45|nr:four helix bundle protein [Mucilaginibacter sp.]PLW89108.1 MAG: four helix bundle protein [Mucilaginibacter sp.]HEK19819.1 four helix bundle protein [Bacteroidota bacterium]